jgi:hypothetical protein
LADASGSIEGACCTTGFLIFALELFVFLAKCDIMSAVSTSLWNVDLKVVGNY